MRERVPPHPQLRQEIAALCRDLAPGGRLPTHTELMRRFGASERAVLRALEELQRSGVIVRRNGVGTFVAETAAPVQQRLVERANTIVVVTPPDHAYFKYCTEVLFDQAQERGLSVVCHFVDENAPALPPSLLSGDEPVGGFLLFRYRLEPLGRQLWERGHRVAILGVPPAGVAPQVPCVHADHERSGYLQVRHLSEQGHRHLLVLHPEDDLFDTLRWRGHQRAARDAERRGEPLRLTPVQGAEWQAWRAEPERLPALLQAPDAPTACLCWNDHQAAQLLALLNRVGIPVPEQMALMGCDNLPESTLVHPALSTVDNQIDQLVHAALDLLTRSPRPPATLVATTIPTLLARASTARK